MSLLPERQGGRGLETASQATERKILAELVRLKAEYSDPKEFRRAVSQRFKNVTSAEHGAILKLAQTMNLTQDRGGEQVFSIGEETVTLGQYLHRDGNLLDGDALADVILKMAHQIANHEKLEEAMVVQMMAARLAEQAQRILAQNPGADIRMITGSDGLPAIQVIAPSSGPAQIAGPVIFSKGGVDVIQAPDGAAVLTIKKGSRAKVGALVGGILLAVATVGGLIGGFAGRNPQPDVPQTPIAGPQMAGAPAKVEVVTPEPEKVVEAQAKPAGGIGKRDVSKGVPNIKLGKDPAPTVTPVGKTEIQAISPEVQKMIATWGNMETVLKKSAGKWGEESSNFKAGKEFSGILKVGTRYTILTAVELTLKAMGNPVPREQISVSKNEITITSINGDFIIKSTKKSVVINFIGIDGSLHEKLLCPSAKCVKK